MEQIDKLNVKINEIEKIDSLEKKTESVKQVKEELKSEQDKVDKMIEKISNTKSKKYKKFKGLSLEALSKMFTEEENLEDKIQIYQQMNYLIDLTKNQLFESEAN
tara:strand:+ start:77 stop:391 length:315 start_codon:yes stop_codon:yes gene_type:complete